jgi:hypothetical protein
MAYGIAPIEGMWLLLEHHVKGYINMASVRGQFRLILGTNWRFVQFLDAGLLVPYRGNNTQSTPPAGKLFY